MKTVTSVFFFVLFSSAAAVAQPYEYCIKNVSIISPEKTEAVVTAMDVYIAGDKIALIRPASKNNPPATHKIDGTGKYLMAGLSDMHVHLPTSGYQKQFLLELAAGVTCIRSMRGKYWHLALRDSIRKGEVLAPDLILATPYFPNKSITIETLADSIAAYKQAGFDCIKVLAVPDSAYYEALMIAAKKVDLPVVGHQPFEIPIDRLIESGYHCIEHLMGLQETYLKDTNLIRPLVAKMIQYNTWNCPTIDYYNIVWQQEPIEQLEHRLGIEYVDTATLSQWRQTMHSAFERTNRGTGDSVVQKKKKLADYMHSKFKLLKMLNDLGAPIIFSPAEAGDPYGVPGFCVWEEMNRFSEAGISNKDILKIATYNTAVFLGQTDSLGSIAEGKIANLVLLKKNPIENIQNIQTTDGTFIHGEYYLRSSLLEQAKSMQD